MTSPSGRRLSTGGMPPVKIRFHDITEQVPSHDETLCYTAWVQEDFANPSDRYSPWDFPINDKRPQLSLQIYDITPGSDNPGHLESLAHSLHEETWEDREMMGRGERDRIDVWGMPLASDMPEEEVIETCRAHVSAEIASREMTGVSDFHIPRLEVKGVWKRAIIIIDRPKALWNEGEGGFLAVYWDRRESYGDDNIGQEVETRRYTRDRLGSALEDLREVDPSDMPQEVTEDGLVHHKMTVQF